MTLRVLVVQPEWLTRSALTALIDEDPRFDLAGTAATSAHALDLIASAAPDVVVVDLFLPDGDACGLVLQAAGTPASSGVVVLSDFATASAAAVCRSVGILTCLSRAAPPGSVLAALAAAGERRAWSGPGAVVAGAAPPLNYLQTLVLAEVASGESNESMSKRLGYSPNYIKDVVAQARSSLGARDRAHAASLCVAFRLVRPTGGGRFAPAVPALAYLSLDGDQRDVATSTGPDPAIASAAT